ncbi:MAG: NUDIX hydrolase [Thermoleophilaceae bacterium]
MGYARRRVRREARARGRAQRRRGHAAPPLGVADPPARILRRPRGAAGAAKPRAAVHGRRVGLSGGAAGAEDRDERATAVRELEEEAGVSLPGDAELARYSRWITPAQVKVRFDTHFFVARAPDVVEVAVDRAECVDFRWIRPADALAAGEHEELLLVFPTIKHLEQLAEHANVDDAMQDARSRKVLPVEPKVLTEGGVARVVLPGDPGYD